MDTTRTLGADALSALEVAAHLGVHYNTVKRIPPDELPFFRIGTRTVGLRRYRPEDVQAYIESRLIRTAGGHNGTR